MELKPHTFRGVKQRQMERCGDALNLIRRSYARVYSCSRRETNARALARSQSIAIAVPLLTVIDRKRMASSVLLRATRFRNAFPGTLLVACCPCFVEFSRTADRARGDNYRLSFRVGMHAVWERETSFPRSRQNDGR